MNENYSVSFDDAAAAPTRFVEVGGRKLAYRSVGKGKPIVLCHRFRGVLDLWDPAFIDSLTAEGFQVVTFGYSGLGQSTGEKSYNPASLVQDAKDLIDALGLRDVVIGGWSIGGIASQIFLAMFGANVSHVVLLATTPPGKLVKTAEQIAFQRHQSEGLSATYHFTFSGSEEAEATVVIKDKSIRIEKGHAGVPDVSVHADAKTWLRVLHKESSMLKEIVLRRIRVKGPLKLFKAFGKCFA
jgi:pimeloyl-ACP methyl ester carboxylesterase